MGANDTGNDPTFPTPPPADRPVFVVAIPAPSIRPETAIAQEAAVSSWLSPFVYKLYMCYPRTKLQKKARTRAMEVVEGGLISRLAIPAS